MVDILIAVKQNNGCFKDRRDQIDRFCDLFARDRKIDLFDLYVLKIIAIDQWMDQSIQHATLSLQDCAT